MNAPISVLVVDDERYVRDSLCEVLQAEGLRTSAADGAEAAVELLGRERFDVIVTDLSMPSGDGLALLDEANAAGIAIPILVITGVGTVADAVAAMKAGAFDFLQKPVDPDELVLLVRRAATHRELEAEVADLRRQVQRLDPRWELVARSPAMVRVLSDVAKVAPTETTVLVRGEVGTGKELVAATIHRHSARAAGPYVVVDSAALAPSTCEAALFGPRGKLVEAGGGTLVLDNVGALDPAVQARLVRVLETRSYTPPGADRPRAADVRWIAIAHEDLGARAAAQAFRSDLLLRLAAFPISVPALRDRRADLAEICAQILTAAGADPRQLTDDAMEVLASYAWPGNVRELRNALERAALLSEGAPLDAALLRDVLEIRGTPGAVPAEIRFNLRRNIDALERDLVLRAIARTHGHKREACDLLGIDARNLGYYLRKHKIGDDEVRAAAEG